MVEVQDLVVRWTAGLMIDADGAYRAYHPDGVSGLDNLKNAKRKDGSWVGVVLGTDGLPVIQGPKDPAPGFYVSGTALQDKRKAKTDPLRYVDSETVPYIAVPNLLLQAGLTLGDVALVEYRGRRQVAVVADVGPAGKLGEGSIALAKALGIPSSPRNGGVSSGVSVQVWRNTSKGWPRVITIGAA